MNPARNGKEKKGAHEHSIEIVKSVVCRGHTCMYARMNIYQRQR
jgi:hypothetical protein